MTLDILFKAATVVDGTGAPRFTADVGIVGGRIAEVGRITAHAKRVVEAAGLVLAPGAVDVHTHYDAQLCWDGALTSSSLHGTTTVVTGNCGIGVAPCRPEHRDISMHDLVVLEGISYDTMKEGITWEFESFPDYLGFLTRRGLGVDVAALVPIGPLRRWEMGDEAIRRGATTAETRRMAALLAQAIEGGAFGFSVITTQRQSGYQGQPLPTQLANEQELRAYANVLKQFDRGVIQTNVVTSLAKPTEEELATIDLLLRESGGRPVTYSGALYRADDPGAIERMLTRCEELRQRGAMPQTTIMPMTVELDLRSPMILSDVPAFRELLNRTVEEQIQAYSDPTWRDRARGDLQSGLKLFGKAWMDATVLRAVKPELQALRGKSVVEIAKLRGTDPFDTMMDLALEDGLELKLLGSHANNDHGRLGQHIQDPRVLVGLHDGGAHVDQMFQAGFPTYLLGHWVRDEKVMSLEHAVKRITAEPADFLRMRDRGRVAVGLRADLMVFDPARVGSAQPPARQLFDLPAGGVRLFSEPEGMHYVTVAGEFVVDGGRGTGAMPGGIVEATA